MFRKTDKEATDPGSSPRAVGATARHPFYQAEVERPALWKCVIRLCPRTREAEKRYRQLNAFVYQLAAEIEVRSEQAGILWAVVPNAADRSIKMEMSDEDDPGVTSELIMTLLKERGLR